MNPQKQNMDLDKVALLASSGMTSGAQNRLAELLEQEFSERRAAKDADKAQLDAFREAQLNAVRATIAERERQQAQCPHMKPNFRPATGGQRDSKGKHHFICQYCGKEYGDDLPAYLRISSDMIGGPQ